MVLLLGSTKKTKSPGSHLSRHTARNISSLKPLTLMMVLIQSACHWVRSSNSKTRVLWRKFVQVSQPPKVFWHVLANFNRRVFTTYHSQPVSSCFVQQLRCSSEAGFVENGREWTKFAHQPGSTLRESKNHVSDPSESS